MVIKRRVFVSGRKNMPLANYFSFDKPYLLNAHSNPMGKPKDETISDKDTVFAKMRLWTPNACLRAKRYFSAY